MIITGIALLFLAVGILAGVSIAGLFQLSQRFVFRWYSWIAVLSGISLVLCALAWSVTSILEHETQAAGMGVIFFGLPGIILLFLTGRTVTRISE